MYEWMVPFYAHKYRWQELPENLTTLPFDDEDGGEYQCITYGWMTGLF